MTISLRLDRGQRRRLTRLLRKTRRRNRAAIGAGRAQLHLASADALPPFTEPFDKVMARARATPPCMTSAATAKAPTRR